MKAPNKAFRALTLTLAAVGILAGVGLSTSSYAANPARVCGVITSGGKVIVIINSDSKGNCGDVCK